MSGEHSKTDGLYDVAIVGGGPGGSACAVYLKKFCPGLRVTLLERDVFPRDHVGEGLIQVGRNLVTELDPNLASKGKAQVGKGAQKDQDGMARVETPLVVERGEFDWRLLTLAAELGCDVMEGAHVRDFDVQGDEVRSLTFDSGEELGQRLQARYFVDASGSNGFLRRRLGVRTRKVEESPRIAIWDYWSNVHWNGAVEATRTISKPSGWIWVIPFPNGMTSLGIVTDIGDFKQKKLKTVDYYADSLDNDPRVRSLIRHAVRQGKLATVKDWSYLSHRGAGKNWFLVGDSLGFADPVLFAGVSVALLSAKNVASSIACLLDGKQDPGWVAGEYERQHLELIERHIQLTEKWYGLGGKFEGSEGFCKSLADGTGDDLSDGQALEWMLGGGITSELVGGARPLGQALLEELDVQGWSVTMNNRFRLKHDQADKVTIATYRDGRVVPADSYMRDGRRLVVTGLAEVIVKTLQGSDAIDDVVSAGVQHLVTTEGEKDLKTLTLKVCAALEAMARAGWVKGDLDRSKPCIRLGE